MPGFGLDGPWRDNPAFAFVIEDAAGLTWMTGHPDQNPVSPYCVGDSNAGLHAVAGLLVALEHRRRTGEGALVEAAMVDAALKDRKSTRLNSRQSCAPRQPSSD